MKLEFKTNKLKKSVSDLSKIKANYGTRAKLVNQRKNELESAASLEVMRSIPAANCHELSGDLAGCLAVDISGNHRIIFKPDHDTIPQRLDGGLDWRNVTQIIILDIGADYH